MKKSNCGLIVFFILLAVSCSINVYAQRILKCGPSVVNTEAVTKAIEYEKTHKSLSANKVLLRIYFHVCETDQGTGANVTDAMMQEDIDHLIHAYSPDNICFLNCGYNILKSSALDTFNFSKNDANIFTPYIVPDCINIFYIDQLGGVNGSSGGGASGITYSDTWTIVAKGYIGAGTTEHEVGHCMGLIHTFNFSTGLEDIDESNGNTSADLIADTPADPYVFENEDLESCYTTDVTGCTYTGNCQDPKGKTNYTPPYSNLMSYWCQGWYPTYTLTAGQYTRINSILSTDVNLQACESPLTYTLGPNVHYQSNYFISSAVTNYTTTGSVVFDGLVDATLGGQLVDLKPGFDANANNGANISIEASACNYTAKSAINNNIIANAVVPASTNLTAYPNPTSSIVHLDFTIDKDEHNVVIQTFNMQMQKVEEIKLGDLIKGKQNITVDLSKQASGLYYIFIQLQNEKLSAKVSVIK